MESLNASHPPQTWVKKRPAVFLATGLLAATMLVGCGSGNATVHSADIFPVAREEVSRAISVSGTVEADRTASLFTSLTAPVSRVAVAVGDRVNQGQVLAELDRSQLERQIRLHAAELADARAQGQDSLAEAQDVYSSLKDSLDRGLNTTINTAEANLRTANDAWEKAKRDFDRKQEHSSAWDNPKLRSQGAALDSARSALLNAQLNSLRASYQVAEQQEGQEVPGLIDASQALDAQNSALQALQRAEKDYSDALVGADDELLDAHRAATAAWEARTDAELANEAAHLGAQQELRSAERKVASAQRAANTGSQAAAVNVEQLQVDLANAVVRAPFSGLVSQVDAKEGQPASGALLTVVDDSKLLVKAEVKEADLNKVKEGSEVRFTTPATGTKEFKGRVRSVSPVGTMKQNFDAKDATQSANRSSQIVFPVVIELVGDTQGLKVGSSARTKILEVSRQNTLAVPASALIKEDDGTSSVLVLTGDESKPQIEKRTVEVAVEGDAMVAITSGLEEGDRVLNQADSYQPFAGSTAKVEE